MGILDIFKKSTKDTEGEVDEKVEPVDKESTCNDDEIDINIKEIDNLTTDRCNELISHVLKDKDFGEEAIKIASLREMIFITTYMRNTLLKQFEGDNVNDLYDKFLETIELFEDMLFEKVMNTDKLWKIINKATGCSVIDNNEEPILISDMYKDNIIEQLKKAGIVAEAVEINHKQFVNELDDLYRTGYKGMRFTDGRQAPCVLKRERMVDPKKVPEFKHPVNPKTHFALAAYLQEFRRGVSGENQSKVLNILGRVMMGNIVKSKFIIPVQEVAENQFNLPIYQAGKDDKGQTTDIGLYVFTDEVEMQKLSLTGLDLSKGWTVQVNELKDIIDKVETCNISEICINFASTQFRLNRDAIESLKKEVGIVSKQDEVIQKQEKFEKEELPKIFDKETKIVRAPNEMPVFMREDKRVCINNFIINALQKNDMFDKAMNSFFEEDTVDVVKVFDVRNIDADIVIRNINKKSGLFVMPMRYDDEGEKEPVNDDTMHYTANAAELYSKNSNYENNEVSIIDRTMHFYTIANSGTQKTYLPLFKDINEVQKIFDKNMFRFCTVTFDDVKAQLKDFDGIVIGPTTLSTIIPSKFVDKIYDIEM